jgi:hypothetical protein
MIEMQDMHESLRFTIPDIDVQENPDEIEALAAALGILHAYAYVKQFAVLARKEKRFKSAKAHERKCEELYEMLPLWAQWRKAASN